MEYGLISQTGRQTYEITYINDVEHWTYIEWDKYET